VKLYRLARRIDSGDHGNAGREAAECVAKGPRVGPSAIFRPPARRAALKKVDQMRAKRVDPVFGDDQRGILHPDQFAVGKLADERRRRGARDEFAHRAADIERRQGYIGGDPRKPLGHGSGVEGFEQPGVPRSLTRRPVGRFAQAVADALRHRYIVADRQVDEHQPRGEHCRVAFERGGGDPSAQGRGDNDRPRAELCQHRAQIADQRIEIIAPVLGPLATAMTPKV